MREKLNENPIAQLGLIAVLLVAGAFLLLKPGGGEEAEEASSAGSEVTATAEGVEGAVEEPGSATVSGAGAEIPSSVPAPPPPAPVTAAYEADKTVVLLVVHDGGIDDALTKGAAARVMAIPDTALFVVPVTDVARYAAITVGLDLSQVPALVVMRPKHLSHGVPQATVDYGLQTPQSVVQAVIDAGYKGPEATYHPD